MDEYIASVTPELLNKQEYTTLAQLHEWKKTVEAYVLHGVRFGCMYPKKSQSVELFSSLLVSFGEESRGLWWNPKGMLCRGVAAFVPTPRHLFFGPFFLGLSFESFLVQICCYFATFVAIFWSWRHRLDVDAINSRNILKRFFLNARFFTLFCGLFFLRLCCCGGIKHFRFTVSI